MRQRDMPRDKHAMLSLIDITDVQMQVKKNIERTKIQERYTMGRQND